MPDVPEPIVTHGDFRLPALPALRGDRSARRRTAVRSWLVLFALLAISSCRLRRTDENAPQVTAESQPVTSAATLPQELPTKAEVVPAAVLLLVGFGDAGFATLRDARREAKWLHDALSDGDEPLPRLSSAISDLSLRRWALEPGQSQVASVTIGGAAAVSVRAEASERLFHRALAALERSSSTASTAIPVTLLPSTPEADWSLLDGPLAALVRAPSGEFAAFWTDVQDTDEDAAPMRVSQRSNSDGVVLAACACTDDRLLEQATEALVPLLRQPASLQREAASWRERLMGEAFDEQEVAVLALGVRIVVDGGGAQIVAAQGADWKAPVAEAAPLAPLPAAPPAEPPPAAPDAGVSQPSSPTSSPLSTPSQVASDAGADAGGAP